jgi:hypothetical protein
VSNLLCELALEFAVVTAFVSEVSGRVGVAAPNGEGGQIMPFKPAKERIGGVGGIVK